MPYYSVQAQGSDDYHFGVRLVDASSQPITVDQSFRVSLWKQAHNLSGDINPDGSINSSALFYDGYHVVQTFSPNTEGEVEIHTAELSNFPLVPISEPCFLQLEYKAPSDPDTSYQTYDFLPDDPNFKRISLQGDIYSYMILDAGIGTGSDVFILDSNDTATSYIDLYFGGQAHAKQRFDIVNDKFIFTDSMKISGDAGDLKLKVASDAGDTSTQQEFAVTDSDDSTLFAVEKSGEVDVSRNGVLRNLVATTGSAGNATEPLLDWGTDSDGTVSFNVTFASPPIVQISMETSDSTLLTYSYWVTSTSTTGFTYKVVKELVTLLDVTDSVTVHWVAFGAE